MGERSGIAARRSHGLAVWGRGVRRQPASTVGHFQSWAPRTPYL